MMVVVLFGMDKGAGSFAPRVLSCLLLVPPRMTQTKVFRFFWHPWNVFLITCHLVLLICQYIIACFRLCCVLVTLYMFLDCVFFDCFVYVGDFDGGLLASMFLCWWCCEEKIL